MPCLEQNIGVPPFSSAMGFVTPVSINVSVIFSSRIASRNCSMARKKRFLTLLRMSQPLLILFLFSYITIYPEIKLLWLFSNDRAIYWAFGKNKTFIMCILFIYIYFSFTTYVHLFDKRRLQDFLVICINITLECGKN